MKQRQLVESPFTVELERAGYSMQRGWNDDLAAQLIDASREPEMIRSVPRDVNERFVDMVTAREWHESRLRTVYSLTNIALAGVLWYSFSPREDLKADYTLAIRLYTETRGKGLATPFMRAAHYDFEDTARYEGSVWLETGTDNVVARRLYEKMGYQAVTETATRLTMVREPDRRS